MELIVNNVEPLFRIKGKIKTPKLTLVNSKGNKAMLYLVKPQKEVPTDFIANNDAIVLSCCSGNFQRFCKTDIDIGLSVFSIECDCGVRGAFSTTRVGSIQQWNRIISGVIKL